MKMRYAFFPGCVARNVYPSIEKSTRMVFEKLEIELVDEPYSCCPAPGVIGSYDKESWLTLGARNICLSEGEGMDVMAICNGCYGTLHRVYEELSGDRRKVEMVNAHLNRIGLAYRGTIKPIHFIDVLNNIKGRVEEEKEIDLGLRVAVHYGCHYLRPKPGDAVYNVEKPTILEEFVEMLGCESVEFKDKLSCCGAGGGVWSGAEGLGIDILREKVRNIYDAGGADCIVNICPFCHMHIDQSQKKRDFQSETIPTLHLNQLIGLSFGMKDKALGLHTHMVSTREIVKVVKKAKGK
jgi:heterodisulfide reductase subunit B